MNPSQRVLGPGIAAFVVAFALPFAAPGNARAQTDERFAMSLVGTLGLGGQLRVRANHGDTWTSPFEPPTTRPELTTSALRPSVGGGLRLEFVPLPHLALGAAVTLLGTETVNEVVRRVNDFGVFLAGRLPISVLEDGRTLTPYVLIPAGLSTGVGGPIPGDRRSRLGVHAGVLLGAEVEVVSGLSLFLEVGFQFHALWYQYMGLRETWRANQALVQLGLRAAR